MDKRREDRRPASGVTDEQLIQLKGEMGEALAEGKRRNDEDVARPRPRREERSYRHRPTETVRIGSLEGNLPEELLSYVGDGYRHVMIVELDDFRYVQFLVTEKDLVITEAASNVNQHPDHLLSYEQQAKLVELGFAEPEQGNPNQPNFHIAARGAEAVIPACIAILRVLRDVYSCSANDEVRLVRFDTVPETLDPRFDELHGLI